MREIDRSSSTAVASAVIRSSRAWVSVWEPMVTSPDARASAAAAHVIGAPPFGEGPLALDEVGGQVVGDGHAVAGEYRERLVDEVGGAVVEGEGNDGPVVGGRLPGGRAGRPPGRG